MKKPSRTAGELEASIKVEMEMICDWPTDIAISVQPDGGTWKVVFSENLPRDSSQRDVILLIAEALKCEFDLRA